MKKQLVTVFGLIAMITVLAGCNTQKLQTIGTDAYYVQIIDGGKEYETGYDPRYEYTLTGYDKDGNSTELVFTAGRQLKENAYLKIYYKEKKEEVIYYEEVAKDDVPKEALSLLK